MKFLQIRKFSRLESFFYFWVFEFPNPALTSPALFGRFLNLFSYAELRTLLIAPALVLALDLRC